MPQCPACKAEYEIGQRYCQKCDSYLLDPEEGDHFCPECGIRVALHQEVCHKCNATLPGTPPVDSSVGSETPQAEPEPPPSDGQQVSQLRGLPLWASGSLIGAGFIILILLAVIFTTPSPKPSQEAVTSPFPGAMTPSPQASPTSAPGAATVPKPEGAAALETPSATSQEESLKEQVRETLSKLRQAQLEQDIILFMSCYSYIYPSLDKKRKQTLAYWKDFRFMDLEFSLDEIKPLGPDSLLAQVTWALQLQNRRSQEFESSTQIFEVSMGKELGAWRIRSLKDVSDYE